jgi:hypothetical protein
VSYIEPPWYFWLAILPSYGTPICVILWAMHRYGVMKQSRKALKGLALGLGAWLGLTILYFVGSFILEPCLENCSRFRTPEGNARAFAAILIYTVLAAVILWRLDRYGRRATQRETSLPRA